MTQAREVNDDLGPHPGRQLAQQHLVREIEIDQLDTDQGGSIPKIGAGHLMPEVPQVSGEAEADESRDSGNEDAHAVQADAVRATTPRRCRQ